MFFTLSSTRTKPDDDNWDTVDARVDLVAEVSGNALKGLDSFSHAIVAFVMHHVDDDNVSTAARHPRDRSDLPEVGIFAQRASGRPNRLGITVCRIIRVEDRCVWLHGLDAIDGSPVVDIKPWVTEFGPRGTVYQPEWMTEIMTGYWNA